MECVADIKLKFADIINNKYPDQPKSDIIVVVVFRDCNIHGSVLFILGIVILYV